MHPAFICSIYTRHVVLFCEFCPIPANFSKNITLNIDFTGNNRKGKIAAGLN